jgi:hypothetical protein
VVNFIGLLLDPQDREPAADIKGSRYGLGFSQRKHTRRAVRPWMRPAAPGTLAARTGNNAPAPHRAALFKAIVLITPRSPHQTDYSDQDPDQRAGHQHVGR